MTDDIKRLIVAAVGSAIISSVATAQAVKSPALQASVPRYQAVMGGGPMPSLYLVDTYTGTVTFYFGSTVKNITKQTDPLQIRN